MSYEEVSDVEEGLDWKSEETVVALARQRYPQANSDVEALFLGRLDDAIENFTPEIRIPRLGIDKFASEDGARTSFAEVLNSLKLPTSALVITVSSAVISILSNNPLVKIAFPYFSCILTFLSAVPSIRERFFAKASSLFAQFDSMKSRVEEAIDRVASKSFKLLHTTESAMNKVLAPINAKLTAITQIESMLKQVKPDIDIPGKRVYWNHLSEFFLRNTADLIPQKNTQTHSMLSARLMDSTRSYELDSRVHETPLMSVVVYLLLSSR